MGGRVAQLRTAHENPHIFTASNLELYENFVVDLERRMQLLNIGMYTMHAECGRGQVEVGGSCRHCSHSLSRFLFLFRFLCSLHGASTWRTPHVSSK